MNTSKWFLFGLFFLMLIWSSYTFWKDVFLFIKRKVWKEDDKNINNSKDTASSKFGVEGKSRTYLHPFLIELNNRTRWYSTEIWHVAFAFIGITAIAIGQVIDKKPDYLAYVFAASAVLGLFVVWHMTRLRRSEQRNIHNLARIEEELGLPKPNQAKTNPLPKPFQSAIILVVIFYGFMASMTINRSQVDSVSNTNKQYDKRVNQDKIRITLPDRTEPDSTESNVSK